MNMSFFTIFSGELVSGTVSQNQGPGPTDLVGELLWPQVVLSEDGTRCGHIALRSPAGTGTTGTG